jgi:hypothetical protein
MPGIPGEGAGARHLRTDLARICRHGGFNTSLSPEAAMRDAPDQETADCELHSLQARIDKLQNG